MATTFNARETIVMEHANAKGVLTAHRARARVYVAALLGLTPSKLHDDDAFYWAISQPEVWADKKVRIVLRAYDRAVGREKALAAVLANYEL